MLAVLRHKGLQIDSLRYAESEIRQLPLCPVLLKPTMAGGVLI